MKKNKKRRHHGTKDHRDCSSMTYWRKRMREKEMELLLKETINVAKTVQEKNIEFSTDSGLYYKAINALVRLSEQVGIKLRQILTSS